MLSRCSESFFVPVLIFCKKIFLTSCVFDTQWCYFYFFKICLFIMKLNRLTRLLFLCPLLLLLLQTSVWAQSKAVTGNVTDDKGAPLQGVSVLVKGTTTGTQTDVSGNFSLNVPSTATTLTFSYVGFAPQDVSIEGKNSVNV